MAHGQKNKNTKNNSGTATVRFSNSLLVRYLEDKEDVVKWLNTEEGLLYEVATRIAGRPLTESEKVDLRLAAWGYGAAREAVNGGAVLLKRRASRTETHRDGRDDASEKMERRYDNEGDGDR